MNRTKITISLSKKALKIIDKYATSTGFESRSRVIDEAIFTITNLLALKTSYEQKIQSTMMKTNSSQPEAPLNIFMLMDTLSKWGGILETFERFPDDTKTQTPIEHNRKIYRKASIDPILKLMVKEKNDIPLTQNRTHRIRSYSRPN